MAAELPKCNWTGASGTSYLYFIHKLPVNFTAGQFGNYIFAKVNAENKWVPIYMGEGELHDRVSNVHHQWDCIQSKGATHIHAHINNKEQDRLTEERDLLARYTNAYAPSGCNEKKGG
jgi:hypothetical protein